MGGLMKIEEMKHVHEYELGKSRKVEICVCGRFRFVKPSPLFTVMTGKERFKVIDLASGGISYFDAKEDAYKMAAVISIRWRHAYQIEDTKGKWISTGGI
jgi:hypothetical protein